jgi:hypothetical protein
VDGTHPVNEFSLDGRRIAGGVMKINGVVVVVSYLQKDSGHERPFVRPGQAELARIFPSQLQISPGSRLRIGFDNVDVGSKYQFLVSAGLTIRENEESRYSWFGSLRVMEPALLQLGNGAGHAGRQHDACDQVIS